MATKTQTTALQIDAREPGSSRDTRRLRRQGRVPGVLYGMGKDPVSFSVDARELRIALQGSGAVLDVTGTGDGEPAVLKSLDVHPVRGDYMHLDLLRVDLNVKITATVTIELTGAEEAPGVVEGGILDHVTREIEIEALPSDIPESIVFDVSTLNIGDTVPLSELVAPAGVTITLDEDDETVLATVVPPTLEPEEDETETETELVGEDGEPVAAAEGEDAAEGDGGDDSSGDGE